MAKKVYYGVETEVPVYEGDYAILNTDTLLKGKFTFSGVNSSTDAFTLSTTGVFTSNNDGAYTETEYEDEETGETVYEEEGVSAWMRWDPKQSISNLSFDWKVSSEENFDILYIYKNSTLLVEASGEQNGTIGPLNLTTNDYLTFEYTKDSSSDQGTDTATISNVKIDARVQVGTEIKSVAKKVNNIYLGINNVAKKVVEGYIGIGGTARPFWKWGEGPITYYGTITPLSSARANHAAASVGNYALFAGGVESSSTNNVNVYDALLTRLNSVQLSSARSGLAGTTLQNYALFGGSSYVDAFDSFLTRHLIEGLSVSRTGYSVTAVDNHALFAGGHNIISNVSYWYKDVDVYDTLLTHTTAEDLSYARQYSAAATVGNYAVIAGGMKSYSSPYTYVDAYASTLTHTIPSWGLSTARAQLAATTIGDYAIFGGGCIASDQRSDVVNTFNTFLSRGTIDSLLSGGAFLLTAITLGDHALFAGGEKYNTYGSDIITVYDETCTRTQGPSLSVPRSSLQSAMAGNYALFAGGNKDRTGDGTSYERTATVDAYTFDL